jgi:hypothetical protein
MNSSVLGLSGALFGRSGSLLALTAGAALEVLVCETVALELATFALARLLAFETD